MDGPQTNLRQEEFERVALLIAQRNNVDVEIAAITGRPVVAGHLGEWNAAQIFDIELESSAVAKAIDGRFRSGPLSGKTVNVTWYGREEALLDVSQDPVLDYYLVMTGPRCGGEFPRRDSTAPDHLCLPVRCEGPPSEASRAGGEDWRRDEHHPRAMDGG